MDALQRINQALAHIEANLEEEIDYRQIETITLCSEYHFRRLFSFLAGVSLGEYVRRRRLTLAAFALQEPGSRIIDVALRYGYSSPDAFSRAFLQLHGITPSEARKAAAAFTAFPQLTFQLKIDGATEMNYRIVTKESFSIVGLMKRVPLIYAGANPDIDAMWQGLTDATIGTLKALSTIEPTGLISASTNFSDDRQEGSQLDHYIGVATDQAAPAGFASLLVPAGTWAIFTARGPFPETLQKVWGSIYAEWFPTASYEQAVGPEILWNAGKDTGAPDFHSEIWIPVQRRQQ